MEQKTILFSDTIPENEAIITALSTTFPNYNSRISFNDILYVEKRFIQASVAIYRKKQPIQIETEVTIIKNDPKMVLGFLFVGAALAYLISLGMEHTVNDRSVSILGIIAGAPYFLYRSSLSITMKDEQEKLLKELTTFFIKEFGGQPLI